MSARPLLGRWGQDLRDAVGTVIASKSPAEKLSALLTDTMTAINALPPADTPNTTDARKTLTDRHAALLVRVNALPAKPNKTALKTLKAEVGLLPGGVTLLRNYGVARTKALTLEREVKVLNIPRGGITPVYQQPLTDALTEADLLVKTDVLAATNKLKTTDDIARRQKKLAESQRDTALEDAKHKPLFEDKVRRIRAAVKQLEPLPGTGEQRDKLNGLVLAGLAAAGPGEYEAAYNELSGLSSLLKAGLAASENFARQAGGPEFKTLLTKTEATFDTFSELSAFADPAAVATYREQIDDTLKTLEVGPTPAKVNTATTELTRIDTELKAAMVARQKDATDWDRILPDVQTGVATLRAAAPLDVYEGVLAGLRAAETLHGLQDHKQAVRQLRKLRTLVNREVPTYKGHYDEWTRLSKDVDEKYLADLERLSTETEVPALRQLPNTLLKTYATAKEMLPSTHDYAAAVPHAQAIVDRFPVDIAPVLRQFEAIEPRRTKGSEDLAKAIDALSQQIDLLKGKGGDTAAATAVIDRARNDWGRASGAATDPTVLVDAYTAAAALVNNERTRLIGLLADPALLKTSQDAGTKKSRQAQLDTATTTARSALQRLGEDFPADVTALQDLRDAVLRQAKTETDAGRPVMQKQVDDMNALVRQIQAKQAERTAAVGVKAGAARQASTAALDRVKKLRKAHDKYAKFFAALEAEVRDAAAMADSSVAKVVEESVARLTTGDIATRLTDLEESDDFDLVTRILGDIDTYLNDDALKTCKPAQRKGFQTRLAQEVLPGAYATTPAEAVTLLRAFRTEIGTAKTAAATAKADRERVKALVTAATTALDQLTKSESPKVYDSLKARIAAAGQSSEGREYDSISKLNALILIIDRLASGTPEAVAQRDEMENTLVNSEFKEQEAKAKWEAQIGQYEKNELRQAKAAYDLVAGPQRDAPRMKQITDLENDGRKLAGKGQYREALLRLDAAKAAARDLRANPMNGAASARGQLKAAATKWKGAVSKFVADLNELADTIRTQAADDPTVDPAAPTLAAKAVREVAASFDPLKFDLQIDNLTADGANLTARRQFKENALRFIRNYTDTLGSDPLLKHVENNPFRPVPLKPLRDRLNDLNLNFQRA